MATRLSEVLARLRLRFEASREARRLDSAAFATLFLLPTTAHLRPLRLIAVIAAVYQQYSTHKVTNTGARCVLD
jgi:hypothetical protein